VSAGAGRVAWGGRRAQRWTAAVLANASSRDELGRPLCVLKLKGCTVIATTGDHIVNRIDLERTGRIHLLYDVTNGVPACLHCNTSKGAALANPKSKVRNVIDARGFFEGNR
jgi:hypothetical protein